MVVGPAEQLGANEPFALRQHSDVVECIQVLRLAMFFTAKKGLDDRAVTEKTICFLDCRGEGLPRSRTAIGYAAHGENILAQGIHASGVFMANAPQFSYFWFLGEAFDCRLVGLLRGDLPAQEAVADLDGMPRTLVGGCCDHCRYGL